ncbi:MAG: FAD-dependent monooxygenase [Parvibaculaceae bacterium]
MTATEQLDAAIVGAGPAGLAAACLLAGAGLKVSIFAGREEPRDDPRAVALMLPSIRLLRHLGIDPKDPALAGSPLRRLRIVDDTGRLFASAPVTFEAREIGEEAFGWNLPIVPLREALKARAATLGVPIAPQDVETFDAGDREARLVASDGTTASARVVIGADGSRSRMRAQAGIGALEWSYDQTAIAAGFSHSAPHGDTSTEFHKEAGPLTTVPGAGNRSTLVWMERPERAAELMAMTEAEFARVLQSEIHGTLGLVSDVGVRRAFPMRGLTATPFAQGRLMLVGEAAHAIPPIGAQGLNLSLRDAATAAELIVTAIESGKDPGDRTVMETYDRLRRRDVAPRLGIIDTVNRTLLSGWALPHAARSLGLALASRIGPARQQVLRQGAGLSEDLPAVMQG